MRIGKPKEILDPYDWMPGYGESGVQIFTDGLDLRVVVQYDREDARSSHTDLLEREFRFSYAPMFLRHPFPGGHLFEWVGQADGMKLGSLTEFQSSEFLEGYLKRRAELASQPMPRLRHFAIQFLAENLAVDVLASDVALGDEAIVRRGSD